MASVLDRYQYFRSFIESEDDVEPEIPDQSSQNKDDKYLSFNESEDEVIISPPSILH